MLTGPVTAGEPVSFGLSADVAYEPGAELQGVLFVGPADAPQAMALPVTVVVPEMPAGDLLTRLSAVPNALETGDKTALSLWVYNQSTGDEAVEISVDVPPGLVLVPGSAQATSRQAFMDLFGRRVTWQGILKGGEGATITFDATAATMSGRVDVMAQTTGIVRGTVADQSIPIWINTERPPTIFFAPIVTRN